MSQHIHQYFSFVRSQQIPTRTSPILVATLLFFSLSLLAIPSSHAQVTTTFDSGLEGWAITGDNGFVWASTGGNPDGNLDVNDDATGAHNFAVPPLVYLGDWSGFASTDSIAFDVLLDNTSGNSPSTPTPAFRITGPGGTAWAIDTDLDYPPDLVWKTYAVPLDASAWTVEEGTFEAILAHVTSLRLNVEFVDGGEEVRLDNIRLGNTPVPIVNDCVSSDFNTPGTGDWTFQDTNGVSNPGDFGNGGGYANVSDKSGVNSYGFAPPLFLGDWSPYDGTGRLSVDLRILSHSGTNLGSPEFIRLSGPGGAAFVSLADTDLSTLSLLWTNYEFPLAEAVWTIESGTWAGLLANITACRIDLEYFGSSESIGFDNFARLAGSCPDAYEPIVVHDPNAFVCGTQGLLAAGGLAQNPLDGKLYSVYRVSPGSGGGLYSASGSQAGTKLASYDQPYGLLFDPAGNAFICEAVSGDVFRYSAGGTSSLWVDGFHSGDDDPYAMCFAPPGFNGPNVSAGDILIVDRGSNGADEIWAFSADSSQGERLVLPDPGSVDFFDIAADPISGTVYVCDDLDPSNLYTLDPSGFLTPFALSQAIVDVYAMVFDEVSGDLFVTGNADLAIYRVTPGTGAVSLFADSFAEFARPTGLEIDSAKRKLWVSDVGDGRIYEICLDLSVGVALHVNEVDPSLLRVSPNPFRPSTMLSFELKEPGSVQLTIFDVLGRRVRTLVESRQSVGTHTVHWDGHDGQGQRLAPGVYFARLSAAHESRIDTRKLVLLR